MGVGALRLVRERVSMTGAEEGLEALRRLYNVQRVEPLTPAESYHAELRYLQAARTGVTLLNCSSVVEMQTDGLDLTGVLVPIRGPVPWKQRSCTAVASPDKAAVFHPEDLLTVVHGNTPVVGVSWTPAVIQRHIERIVGTPVAQGAILEQELRTADGPGAVWAGLLTSAAVDLARPEGQSLWASPLMLAQLEDALLTGLLHVVDHPWRHRLHERRPPWRPAYLKLVTDAIHADPAHPWTLTELCLLAHVSPRALQSAFKTHHGLGPTAYLRRVRLERAHDDLRNADPAVTTVAAVATRWGFTHHPRFARYYRQAYGCNPNHTLLQG